MPFLAILSSLKLTINGKWNIYSGIISHWSILIQNFYDHLCIEIASWSFLAIWAICNHLEWTKNENMTLWDLLWEKLTSFNQQMSFSFFHIRLLNTLSVIKKCYVKCAPVEAAQCSSSVCMIDATEHHTLHEHIECRC